MTSISVILLLLILVFVGIAIANRGSKGRPTGGGDGEDLLTYLMLAVAVGVAAFSLMNLGRAAFPTGGFIWDVEGQVATALAGLVVAVPIAIALWRRQRIRRDLFPRSGGWTLYLTVIEAVFMTSFAVAAYGLLAWLIGDGDRVHYTDILVFGGVVAFHEFAARATPPRSGGSELPRVVGSAIGLIMLIVGSTWLLTNLLERAFGLTPMFVGPNQWGTQLATTIVGGLIWWFRWLRPWPEPPAQARNAWTFLVATFSLATMMASLGTLVAGLLTYLLTDTRSARDFFDFVPTSIAFGLVALAIWLHHRWRLGKDRTDPVRAYEYFSAALGLGTAVGSITVLIGAMVHRSVFVGALAPVAIYAGVSLLLGLGVWYFFWNRAQSQPEETELLAPPRRTYLLGLGALMGLTSAIALIITLVWVFQQLLGVDTFSNQFATTITLFLGAGAASWHLLSTYNTDKAAFSTGETIAAFDVTVICSHPGLLATRFPQQARVRVVYRGDDHGVVTDEMADLIVTEVNNRSSYVWVDESGFRVAPSR